MLLDDIRAPSDGVRRHGGPRAVLAYLSRYIHRIAISNRQQTLPVREIGD
jgi:hypothetical protein